MLYNIWEFEWSDRKAALNQRKHGVLFTEAITIWRDPHSLEIFDPDSSQKEERWVRMGISEIGRLLVVVYVERSERFLIRIISERKATLREMESYSEREVTHEK